MTIERVHTPVYQDNIVDIFNTIVDSIRATGTITSSTESSGIYSIVSPNSLSENEFVVIDSVSYKATSVDPDGFSIAGNTGLDFSGKTWKSEKPYYLHGHLLEIVNIISQQRGSGTDYAYKSYPLIALIEDVRAQKQKGVIHSRQYVNMLIVNSSSSEYKAPARYDNQFDPVLKPIYESLIKAIKASKKIYTRNGHVEHEAFNRLYYGTSNPFGSIAMIFKHPVDAIEIRDLDLKVFNTC